MRQYYSKNGCNTCKSRRKKCDEQKPVCGACDRLHQVCSYSSAPAARYKNSVTVVGIFEVRFTPPPTVTPRALLFADHDEYQILRRAPRSILAYLSLASSEETRKLSDLWPMILQDDLVRNAAVACCSVVMGCYSQHGELHRNAYGKTLQQLRKKLNSNSSDWKENLSVHVGMIFLGIGESFGPEAQMSSLAHWKAILLLFQAKPWLTGIYWRNLSLSLRMFMLELLLYNIACVGMFSKDLLLLAKAWKQAGLDQIMLHGNPEGASRPLQSAIVSGQYEIHLMILEIMCLHRRSPHMRVSEGLLDEMECEICRIESTLDHSLQPMLRVGRTVAEKNGLRDEYRMYCISIRICINALRTPSQNTSNMIDRLASENLHRFEHMEIVDTAHPGMAWALQTLACSIRRQEEFKAFMQAFARFKPHLDPGNAGRTETLCEKLNDMKAAVSDEETVQDCTRAEARHLPIGLSLLSLENGILS